MDVLLLLHSFHKFWTKVRIESEEYYVEKITTYEQNIDNCYKYGSNTIFTDAIFGDGKRNYCHCAKHLMPRLARDTLKHLRCGVGIQTMQSFEHHSNKKART